MAKKKSERNATKGPPAVTAKAAQDGGEVVAVDPWSLEPERAKLADKQEWESFLGGKRFRDLANGIHKRCESGNRIHLKSGEVAVLLEALRDAAEMAERMPYLEYVEQVYQHAKAAAREPGDTTKKAQIVLNRLLGRPDRGPKGRSYDVVRIVQAYNDLTSDVIYRPAFDALGGVDWRRKTWAECGLDPPEGAAPTERITRPLARKDAIRAIAKLHGTTYAGIYGQLKRAKVKGLPSTRPRA